MSNQNSDVLRTAKALGLNISKVCENCLREAIKRLQGYTQQTETNEGYIDARQGVSSASMVGRAGFEPATFIWTVGAFASLRRGTIPTHPPDLLLGTHFWINSGRPPLRSRIKSLHRWVLESFQMLESNLYQA